MFGKGAKVSASQKFLVVVCTAVIYFAAFALNQFFFRHIEFSSGAHWVYLPSGVRLTAVLVFGWWGALGVILGSIGVSYELIIGGNLINPVVAGVISGLSPLLARRLSEDFLGLKENLDSLTPALLLKTAAAFALLSAVLHQLWYVAQGHTPNFMSSTAVMAIGDLTGSLIVLYLAKFALSKLHNSPRSSV